MTDALTPTTPPTVIDKVGMGFGKNQILGLVMTGLPIALGFALVAMGKLDAKDWMNYSQTIAGTGVGTTLGVSGLIKAVEAWRK